MKKNLILLFLSLCTIQLFSQEFEDNQADENDSDTEIAKDTIIKKKKNKTSFDFGDGLNFSFEQGEYQFKLGGFIQPIYQYSKIQDEKSTNEMNVRRAYVTFEGKALKEKISFLLQTDFSLNKPLLDAWVAYHPTKEIKISAGQKRTFLNNREMNVDENNFQFTERSLLSTSMSNTGREFGLFVEGDFSLGKVGISPKVALTSGDGRNSFGESSNDADKGGMKYGGRLDVYPLGYFTSGNDNTTADLLHEKTPKFVIGVAASNNNGASEKVGEGYGGFALYNAEGKTKLPDYRKFYLDLLFKYQGFSFLGEYSKTSASKLDGMFTDADATMILVPGQISSYLLLGEAYNFQAGYVTLGGYSFDLRYSKLTPEFGEYSSDLMQDVSAYSFGFSKYFKGNAIKLQAAVTQYEYEVNPNELRAELLMQISF